MDTPLIIELVLRNEQSENSIWNLCQELLQDGTTYIFRPNTTRSELIDYWFPPHGNTFLGTIGNKVVGCYFLRPNQKGRGSHVANASYFVGSQYRGVGFGRKLAEHSLKQASVLGYRAIQFNMVVSTNQAAVELWKKLGFKTIGVVPGAFEHAHEGFVDAFIMHRPI